MREGGICPYKIIDDFGSGFALGTVLGSLFHFCKGAYQSPKKEKFFGGLIQLKRKAPILGGSFAVWTGTFAFSHCILLYFTKEESIRNQVISGAFTGGVVCLRGGAYSFLRGAVNGGIFLGLIEIFQDYTMKKQIKTNFEQKQAFQEFQLLQMIKQMNPNNPNIDNKLKSVTYELRDLGVPL